MSVTLGAKLKYFRVRASLSQQEAELSTEMSAGQISRIENNLVNPTKETIFDLVKLYNLSLLEYEYLAGKFVNPVTIDEVNNAKKEAHDFFHKKGVLAYLVDERSRVWDLSSDFRKLFNITEQRQRELEGESIATLVIDPSLEIRKSIADEDYPDLLEKLFTRMHAEIGFMVGDEWYQKTLTSINKDPVASEIWQKISSKTPTAIRSMKERFITFNFHGIKFNLEYTVEALIGHEKFRIVEYKPTNIIMKLLMKL